jgi:hypothetical protein
VLANLLGTGVEGLLDVRNEVTLKRVLLSMRSVPSDVLFLRQEHAVETGCGWMPTTFLDGGSGAALGLHEGIVTPAGLKVQMPGIRLAVPLTGDEPGPCLTIRVRGYSAYRTRIVFRQHFSNWFSDAEREYAVILKNSPSKVTPVFGALVVVRSQRSQVMTVRWLGVVILTPSRDTEDPADSIVGEVLPPSQEWCVE